jgi:hypothetical protein
MNCNVPPLFMSFLVNNDVKPGSDVFRMCSAHYSPLNVPCKYVSRWVLLLCIWDTYCALVCFYFASNCFFVFFFAVLVTPALCARCCRVVISSPCPLVAWTPQLLALVPHQMAHILRIPHRMTQMIAAGSHRSAALLLWLWRISHGLTMANWSV